MPVKRISNENENKAHFLTITTIEWIDIFTKPQYFHIIIESLKYCRKNKGLLLYEYVIMTNHIHLIACADEGYKLSQIISDFKKHTTQEIYKLLASDRRKYILTLLKNSFYKKEGYQNQIWQSTNYPEAIKTQPFFNQKIKYIHQNPVRKEYVDSAEKWFYSSARNRILGDNSVVELDDLWI